MKSQLSKIRPEADDLKRDSTIFPKPRGQRDPARLNPARRRREIGQKRATASRSSPAIPHFGLAAWSIAPEGCECRFRPKSAGAAVTLRTASMISAIKGSGRGNPAVHIVAIADRVTHQVGAKRGSCSDNGLVTAHACA